jgi:hypothetical protein
MSRKEMPLFPEPECSICGQTQALSQDFTATGSAEALGIILVFATCPHCGTRHVCPDCLHEEECCIFKAERKQEKNRKLTRKK